MQCVWPSLGVKASGGQRPGSWSRQVNQRHPNRIGLRPALSMNCSSSVVIDSQLANHPADFIDWVDCNGRGQCGR